MNREKSGGAHLSITLLVADDAVYQASLVSHALYAPEQKKLVAVVGTQELVEHTTVGGKLEHFDTIRANS